MTCAVVGCLVQELHAIWHTILNQVRRAVQLSAMVVEELQL